MIESSFPSPQDFVEGQLIAIDKPLEWTSFQVVNFIRYRLRRYTGVKKIKVGHAGTLDPLATGLLLICTGRMTKQIDRFMGLEKTYSGTIQLGATTPSCDLETEVDKRFSTDHLTEADVQKAMNRFVGEIDQIPPVYSAIKVNGKRLYERARKGETEDVEIKSRKVHIASFALLDYKTETAELTFRTACSKGTYVRSLARDLGRELGAGGHLSSLRRESIGAFSLERAQPPEVWGREFEKVAASREEPSDNGGQSV